MNGPALVQAVLSGGVSDEALWVASVLLVSCGILGAFDHRVWMAWAPRARVEPPTTSTPRLSAIELALIAELSLEQARANDEVANDASKRPETRRHAAESARGWRERARWFQLQAREQAKHPIVSGPRLIHSSYSGPERRRQMRRSETRRTGPEAAKRVDERDRRARPDRRRRERRGPELAPR